MVSCKAGVETLTCCSFGSLSPEAQEAGHGQLGWSSPVYISFQEHFAAFCLLLVPGRATRHDFHLGGLGRVWMFPLGYPSA